MRGVRIFDDRMKSKTKERGKEMDGRKQEKEGGWHRECCSCNKFYIIKDKCCSAPFCYVCHAYGTHCILKHGDWRALVED